MHPCRIKVLYIYIYIYIYRARERERERERAFCTAKHQSECSESRTFQTNQFVNQQNQTDPVLEFDSLTQ